MNKYRLIPAEVEAIQYTAETCQEIHDWLAIPHYTGEDPEGECPCGNASIIFGTEDNEEAAPGDWIIFDGAVTFALDDVTFHERYEPAPMEVPDAK